MTASLRPVEIVMPERSHAAPLRHDDDWTRAMVNSAIADTRTRIKATPLDWVQHEILACHLVGLSAHLVHQQRGYEAQDALAEAEQSLATARRILDTIGDLGRADILARLKVIRAVVQHNASVLFFQTDNPGPGWQFLGYAGETLADTSSGPYREDLYRTAATAIDELREAAWALRD